MVTSIVAVNGTSSPDASVFLNVIREARSAFSREDPSVFCTGSSKVIVGVTSRATSTSESYGSNIGIGGSSSLTTTKLSILLLPLAEVQPVTVSLRYTSEALSISDRLLRSRTSTVQVEVLLAGNIIRAL